MTKQERKLAKYKKEIAARKIELTKEVKAIDAKRNKIADIIFNHNGGPELSAEEHQKMWREYDHLKTIQNNMEDEIGCITNELLPLDQKYMSQFLWSDVHAYKVVKEFTPCTCGVIRLKTKVKEGSEPMSNEWDFELPEYTEDEILTVRKNKNGRWYFAPDTCPLLLLDHPYEQYDYNF